MWSSIIACISVFYIDQGLWTTVSGACVRACVVVERIRGVGEGERGEAGRGGRVGEERGVRGREEEGLGEVEEAEVGLKEEKRGTNRRKIEVERGE